MGLDPVEKVAVTNGETNLAFVSDEYGIYGIPTVPPPPYDHGTESPPGIPAPEVTEPDAEKGAEEDSTPTRANWDNPIEFLMSCISMSVGLGNIWRFPFTALSNGGGAFLIPYLIVLMVIGRPMYYLEMCVGQFCSRGNVKAWKMAPLFKGVGYTSSFATFATVSFYSVLIGITIFYFFASFAATLPWTICDEALGLNATECRGASAALYFSTDAIPQYEHIRDGLGTPNWRMTLALLGAWICICGAIIKGVKSSGKVAYFTAIFPYLVLFILLIRGVTLPGAGNGIKKFFTPEWSALYDPKVWYEAVGQCFFSLNVGFGPIIMFSSYNSFRHNIARDALIISCMDTFTSLIAGITVFAILGYLAQEQGKTIEEVAGTGGAALAFIAYPSALASFDWAPQLFAVLFFLMLFTLGLGSGTSLAGGVITIICDASPKLIQWQVTVIFGIVTFILGLVYVTQGGLFILDLVDKFAATFVVYVAALLEVGAIVYVYGLKNFCKDVEFMLQQKVHIYYKICWYAIPFILGGILCYWAATYKSPISVDAGYNTASQIAAWLLAAFSLSFIVIFGIHSITQMEGSSFYEKFKAALKPKADWGPMDPKNRREWLEFKKFQ